MSIDIQNLFANLVKNCADEVVDNLVATASVRIERIVSQGQASPPGFWYDQPRHEWVVVLQGAARLLFEDEEQPRAMQRGDCINIPAHRRHRVEWTDPSQPTIWLAVHY